MKNNFVQFAAILLTGLVAGLLFGYSCSVIAGLGDLSAREYILAFQSINKAILNPYFFSVFFGSPVMLVTATYQSYKKERDTVQFSYLLTASLIYIIGVLGITAFGNVPLNEELARYNIKSIGETELRTIRQAFEGQWNRLHYIRTFAAFASFFLSLASVTIKKNEKA